ncbi:MAG: hypothetical protein J0665_03825 [Deltaproteobacteria bacterium]|jgi:hypothetical protein|nr:hypothetical protein [Deltaproteobacteria bacterium]
MSHDIWSVILITGLIGWLFSSIMLMLKAFPQKEVFIVSTGIRWGSAALISFFIWIAGMLKA